MDTEAQGPPEKRYAAEHQALRLWMQRLRKRMGVSQRGLAKITGIHYVTIGEWERGGDFPNMLYRRMLNVYARDVQLEPLPALPKPNYGMAPGTKTKGRRKKESGADGATSPTPQPAEPPQSNP
jgi:DNA-binding transcriptional regulator YiaG